MRPELEATLLHCRNLPSPPGVALQIIELAQDPNASLADAARVVAMDPALSARILRMANSPLYATRRRATTLAQAMSTLGVNATLSLALGFSLMQGLRGRGSAIELQEQLWKRSVLAAVIARLLAQHAGTGRSDIALLGGLLQDIGKLALLHALSDGYARLHAQAIGNDALLALERAAYGDDHASIGAWLARRWNLPAVLVEAIACSEAPAPVDDPLARCVQVSGPIADLWLAGDEPDDHLIEQAQTWLATCPADPPPTLDVLLPEIAAALPDINAIFDIHIDSPTHLQAIGEHARELLILRNLRQIQEMAQARDDTLALQARMRELTEQSRRDPLTGVYNRLHMQAQLEQAFNDAGQDRLLSLAMIDLDDFKQINDRHGHLLGDQVLHQFAQSLHRNLRDSDLVARYGGEEFLVLLPDTDETAAQQALERLLQTITRLPMAVVDGQPLHVSFSAGIATHNGKAGAFPDLRALIEAADNALYRAKHLGRQRICQHTP